MLFEAGGLGAAVSEESMRRLQYCLQWLQVSNLYPLYLKHARNIGNSSMQQITSMLRSWFSEISWPRYRSYRRIRGRRYLNTT